MPLQSQSCVKPYSFASPQRQQCQGTYRTEQSSDDGHRVPTCIYRPPATITSRMNRRVMRVTPSAQGRETRAAILQQCTDMVTTAADAVVVASTLVWVVVSVQGGEGGIHPSLQAVLKPDI